MHLVDSHCHLDFPEFSGEIGSILTEMRQNDVVAALCVAVNLEDLPAVLKLAAGHDAFYASVGVHPGYADCAEPTVEGLVNLAANEKVLALGETGLDYYRESDDATVLRQGNRFRTHIRAALAVRKPLIVHTRAASEDTIRLLQEEDAGQVGGIMHCFTESREVASACLDIGFHVSFSGIITFKNAAALREVAAMVPDDRLLIETDSPYLAPVPHRGKTNRPAFVRHVAEALATIRGVPVERIAELTTANFLRLFPGALLPFDAA